MRVCRECKKGQPCPLEGRAASFFERPTPQPAVVQCPSQRPRAGFLWPSVLRRRHSGRLNHRPWLALSVLVMVRGCAWGRGQSAAVWRSTGAIMGNVVYDFLLFSCMALFVTGIVLAAASLLI